MGVYIWKCIDKIQTERIKSMDVSHGAIDRSAFVPAPAITYPHGPLQEFLHVLEVVVCGPVGHVHALDALCLNLVDAFPCIDAHGLDALHEGTIGDWGTGADERWSEALVSS